ncbi:MAG: TetR/AcrR family transcriptional regulator [Pseudomonadota bacterium]
MPRGIAKDHAEKREGIRKAAGAYFADYGFDRSSMAGAARAAGVSKALIYHYWDSKEDLLFDILEAHLARLASVVDEVGPPDRLRGLIRAILLNYRDADAEHKLQIDALATLPPEKQAPLKAHQRRLVEAMGEALSEAEPDAVADGRLRPVTMAVFGMLNWFYIWHRPGRGMSREDYADLVADLVMGGLRGLTGSDQA